MFLFFRSFPVMYRKTGHVIDTLLAVTEPHTVQARRAHFLL